jgi:hypothetical protein
VTGAGAEELYALPLDEFTAKRDELARSLRKEGRRGEAAEVAALRKPVLAAWVVNRLVREERRLTRRLIDAAAGIKAGSTNADEPFREALDELLAAARALVEREGRSADEVVHQIASTLRTGAASDPELLASGTLTRPLEATGFAAMAGASPARRSSGVGEREKRKPSPRVDKTQVEEARRALAEARDGERSLRRAATEAERRARDARNEADAARERVVEAEARLAEARRG